MPFYFMLGPNEDNFTSVFTKVLAENCSDADYTEEELAKITYDTLLSSLNDAGAEMFAATLKQAKSEITYQRKLGSGFGRRNYKRWKSAFDLLHTMILISQDLGTYVLTELPDSEFEATAKAHAIIGLHAKSLRVGREILCLMENGFADGALGRWRALHEAATIATFLSHGDEELSVRYILARDVQCYRAAKQYIEHEQKANLTPFGDREFKDLQERYKKIIAEHGEEMKHDWGWAANNLSKKRPTFAQIEEACGLDHWRPRYRWSSEDNHANYKPSATHLAMTEAVEPMLPAGQSNSGMEDPGQMLGCSIELAASSLFSLNPSPDMQLWFKVLSRINDKVSEDLLKAGKLKS